MCRVRWQGARGQERDGAPGRQMSRVRETCKARFGPEPQDLRQDPGAERTGELSSESSQLLRYKSIIGPGCEVKPRS